jgi:hypothetical protein
MNTYNITYEYLGRACLFVCKAESDGEAQELFEQFAERHDEFLEILSVKEVG